MAYTKRQFGAELMLELEKGYDTQRVAVWADFIHHKHISEIDDDLNIIIENIASMSFGEQFEYTEKELRDLAIQLMS